MASLSLKHINKTYPNGFEALKNINLKIEQGEFVAVIGILIWKSKIKNLLSL